MKGKFVKLLPIIILLLLIGFLNFRLIEVLLKLKSLPTCIYGCDYYYEQGVIYHLLRNGITTFGTSSVHKGNVPTTPQLYYIFPAAISAILKISPFDAQRLLSPVILAISFTLFYLFFKKLLNDSLIALFSTVSAFPLLAFPIFKYTSFAMAISLPLFFLSLLKFLEKIDWKRCALLGLAIGICGLSHYALFFISFEVVIITFLLTRLIEFKNGSLVLKLENSTAYFTLALFLGFLISLLFWYKPIFVFHGKTIAYGFNVEDFTKPNVYFSFLSDSVERLFFDASDAHKLLIGLLSFFGFFLILLKGERLERALLLSLLFAIYNYLILVPLTGKHLSPVHSLSFLSPIIWGISVGFLFKELSRLLDKRYTCALLLLLVLFITAGKLADFNEKVEKDRFFIQGYEEISPHYKSVQKYLLANASANDVVLSSNELCFVLNGLSGVKCLLYRRGHASKFDDLDEIYLDAAIILYGNDTEKKIELIRELNVTYLYWDVNWIGSEYSFDENGNLMSWFDPITLIYSEDKERRLRENNISYFIRTTWLDPAFRNEKFKKFKLIFISPKNYRSFWKPWKEDLDEYLEEVWRYESDGKVIARLWRVVI